ncbi:PQQ-dependent sugar dehydrogenase [Microbacterium sp. 179-I 3D3 NHS]|uniref:PQQ-dependent sugar dehydrogenase n=1 Tax=Microbacterium sp. 179-I 3D3 NHS TaxID=3142382 RepID=UPI00399FE97B
MRDLRRSGFATASLAMVVVLSACTAPSAGPSAGPTAAPPSTPPVVDLTSAEVVAEGLQAPWSIAFHEGVALVSERDSGRIVQVAADGGIREVGVIDGVRPRGEGGLLGIAVHDGDLYAYLTTADDNRIERFALSGPGDSLRLGPAEEVISGMEAAANHNGGRIAFGPDGMLYATVGDAGDPSSAQDETSLSGKILRLTPEGEVPADNPVDGSPVYSSGHRNPQGLTWAADGTLYASEFGQDTWDELNVIEPGGNYGWPEVEGIAGREGFIDPVQQWNPDDASPSGIAVAGESIFLANLRGERLREVPLADPGAAHEHLVGEHGRLRDAVVAPDGALWILTNNTDGRGAPRDGDDRILRFGVG